MKIEAIPELPDEILDAVRKEPQGSKKLAVFVGAGVSRLVGCDGWKELSERLLKKCTDQTKADGQPLLRYREFDRLSGDNDHKKIITVCYNILAKQNDLEKVFWDEMRVALRAGNEEHPKLDIYPQLRKLNGLFITTNADNFLPKCYNDDRLVFRDEEFDADSIHKTKLYQIHGSINEPKSMIFTVDAYIRRYRDNDRFKEFLRAIFQRYVVLFVGFGMNEFEHLDYLVSKTPEHAPDNFMLKPYLSGDERLCSVEAEYYEALGVNLIPYAIDTKGYSQLYHIVVDWNRKIRLQGTELYDTYSEIDDAIAGIETDDK